MWSLNIMGMTDDGAATEEEVLSALQLVGGITGGTLNITGRPQVVFPGEAPHSKLAMGIDQEEDAVSEDETTEAGGAAPEEQADAGAAEAGAGDAQEAGDGPGLTGERQGTAADYHPLSSYSVSELEAELNRRSAEGQSVTSDGSTLQEATHAEIEAEIAARDKTSDDAEPTDDGEDNEGE